MQMEIQIIAVLIAVSCSIPGVFLVLRRLSMTTDAITHTVLLGIVLAFFITRDLDSPALILGAAITGVFTVWISEFIYKTGLVAEDSSIGLVFPFLFSIAVLLISKYARFVHIDSDTVFLGELAFAPFNRMIIFGVDIGARDIYIGFIVLIINILFVSLFFKELKISTFDAVMSFVVGISPILIHYSLMGIVSFTAVVAFKSVGAILVVAFMVVPPSSAYLITNDLRKMIFFSCIFGALSGILGYHIAVYYDVSISGTMAVVSGMIFAVLLLFSPKRGIISSILSRKNKKKEFSEATVLFHICQHYNYENSRYENGFSTISDHLHWEEERLKAVLRSLIDKGYIYMYRGEFIPTESGIERKKNYEEKYLK